MSNISDEWNIIKNEDHNFPDSTQTCTFHTTLLNNAHLLILDDNITQETKHEPVLNAQELSPSALLEEIPKGPSALHFVEEIPKGPSALHFVEEIPKGPSALLEEIPKGLDAQELVNTENIVSSLVEHKPQNYIMHGTIELNSRIFLLEEEIKLLVLENKRLRTTVEEIENKLTFVFNHVIKTKTEDSSKILNPSIWLQTNKLSESDKLNLEYMRRRNSIIRDRGNKSKNHFMPEFSQV